MDEARFDTLTRVFGSLADRRTTLRTVALGALGLAGHDAKAKRKKKKKKKKDRDCAELDCVELGGSCNPFGSPCCDCHDCVKLTQEGIYICTK